MKLIKYLKRMVHYVFKGPEIIEKGNYTTTNISVSKSSNKLINKYILITGGGSGLGLSIAKKAIEEGAKVVITGRNEKKLKEKSSLLGDMCSYIVCDMTNIKDVKNLLIKAKDNFNIRHFDSIVCNAGISLHEGNLLNVTELDFDRQVQTNLKGNYFLTQSYIQLCLENNIDSGNLLFISSERGLQPDDLPYGLTKVAINSFVKGINKRWIQNGIRANAICPGVTCSDMTGYSSDQNLYVGYNNIKRVMLPEEIAEVATFLMSDISKCISGEIIACDYGNYFSSIY